MEIPIANIYYLLCYAWNVLEENAETAEVDDLESTKLLDLFTKVLVTGTRRLIRRGLDRGYLPQEGELLGIRGKLLVTQTVRRSLLRHGRAACVWDDLEYGTLPNRILKATFEMLYAADDLSSANRADVHDMLRWLNPVPTMDLHTEHFRRIQLHRNNRIYEFLLHVCEFIHEHWLPDEKGGRRRFRDFVRDGLPGLFEKFVLNFYRRELSDDWWVGSPKIHWQMSAHNKDAMYYVPEMKTDVCLKRAGRAIILDTKFYVQALKDGAYGTAKLPSGNLYQLYTYLRQNATEPGWEQAEGVLLYPRTNKEFKVDFTTHGHRIRALTLDLFQPWQQIRHQLLEEVLMGRSFASQ